MLPRRHKLPGRERAEPAPLLPPNLRTLGALPFTPVDRATLTTWLAEGGWPRGTMDAVMLEGYLVALLVWPVGIPPGAWLPPIWGERGWKVPAKMESAAAYTKFINLVVGLLHALDRDFSARPAHFTPTLRGIDSPMRARNAPRSAWAQGFLRALQLDLQGMGWRSPASRSALERIARHASLRTVSDTADSGMSEELASAVLVLAGERSTRGPLGALKPASPDPAVPDAGSSAARSRAREPHD